MPERYLGRLKPDMDVCDMTGKKVGTIAHIYRYAEAATPVSGSTSATPPREFPPYDELMEVKTGLWGLGSHLYIPLSSVEMTLDDGVFVLKSQEEFKHLGWHHKPPYFDQLQ